MQILGNDTSAYHGYNEIHKLQALSDSLNPYYNNNTDWQGVFYQRLTIKLIILVSLVNPMRNLTIRSMQTIITEKGIVKNTDFNRYGIRAAVGYKPNDRFHLNLTLPLH